MLPKRTIILIVLLLLTTILLVFAALKKSDQKDMTTSSAKPTAKVVEKTALLYFDPASITTNTSSISADILINASNHKVSIVQFELGFDPQFISNISINRPDNFSFFGSKLDSFELIKEIDYKNGVINYAVSINPSSSPRTGIGKVATLTFTKKSTQDGTQIKFLDKTKVTDEGVRESILKETKDLTILPQTQ